VRALCDALPDSQEALDLGASARAKMISGGTVMGVPTPELRTWLEEAATLAARGGDARALCGALSVFAMHRAVADIDYDEALAIVAEAQAHAERRGFAAERVVLLTTRLIAEREGGRLEDARRTAELLPRSHSQLPDLASLWAAGWHRGGMLSMSLANRGRLWFLLGRLDDAQREIEEAVAALRDVPAAGVVWHWFLAELARFRGDSSATTRAARAALERGVGDSTHDQRIMASAAAVMHAATGAWSEAAAACERVLSLGYGSHPVRSLLAEARLELGEHQRAREIASEAAGDFARRAMPLRELETQLVLARVLRRCDGLAARAGIEVALARAAALIAKTGARLFAPELCLERAELARLVGDEPARSRELREAECLFREMGAPLRADAVARELAGTVRDAGV
jgi:tetratricopeptide (TPR) repeat protein